jgi:secreted PhoX family phosphatase
MGRMAHEASAFDPATGYWYLTEDNFNANTLYRFLPSNVQGGLGSLHAGGRLQGLAVRGKRNADLRDPKLHEEWLCEWVDIAQPDADGGPLADAVAPNTVASGPYTQAHAGGAAVFGATEGCWVAGGRVWFTDKLVSLLPARAGRIWTLHLASMTLKAVFVSHSVQVGNSPDNICVSPKGGVLFCEDGVTGGPGDTAQGMEQQLKVLHPNGHSSVFAKHHFNFTRQQLDAVGKTGATAGDLRRTEWAGATFSPDGQVLFVNLYSPGVTLAITGPWHKGPL